HRARPDLARPPSNRRYAEATLVCAALHAAEWRVPGVRPGIDPGAVVGGPDHTGVLGEAKIADGLHYAAGIVVELHQRILIWHRGRRFTLPFRRREIRLMHLHEVEVHEERLRVPGMILDPFDRCFPNLGVAGVKVCVFEVSNFPRGLACLALPLAEI